MKLNFIAGDHLRSPPPQLSRFRQRDTTVLFLSLFLSRIGPESRGIESSVPGYLDGRFRFFFFLFLNIERHFS